MDFIAKLKRIIATTLILFNIFTLLSGGIISGNAAPSTNLIQNPSVETANGVDPINWSKQKWGDNTTNYTYENTGKTGNKSIKVQMTNYVSGDARWGFDTINVVPTTSYDFSAYYQSDTSTQIWAAELLIDNTYKYSLIGNAVASNTWKQSLNTYSSSPNVKSVNIYFALSSNGFVQTDDYSLAITPPVTPPPVIPPTTNLIQNPSVETANGVDPINWSKQKWGDNTTNYTYENTGKTGNKSIKVQMTNYVSGDARWGFDTINVVPSTDYNFSAYFQSNVSTKIWAVELLNDNTNKYVYLGEAQDSSNWRQYGTVYKSSPNVQSVNIYFAINQVGFILTDDYVLESNTISKIQREGKWNQIGTTNVVGIQAATLPGGNILLFDGTEGVGIGDSRQLNYEIYNTQTKTTQKFLAKDNNGIPINYAAFCAAMVSIKNKIFLAGGDVNGDAFGSTKSGFFTPATNTWELTSNMQYPRWYPSGIVTFNGQILVVGGTQVDYNTPANTPEIFNLTNNTWVTLTSATDNFDSFYKGGGHFYPWLYNLTNDKVANIGPRPTISTITTSGTGVINKFASRDLYDNDNIFSGRFQAYGSVARISDNKVLVTGGGVDDEPGNHPIATEAQHDHGKFDVFKPSPTETANIIRLDLLNQPAPIEGVKDEQFTQETSRPKVSRTSGTLVILPDGNVMLAGGTSLTEGHSRNEQYNNAVMIPELWNRDTEIWTSLAEHPTKRIYHTINILQKDSTILQAGGSGFDGQCTTNRGVQNVIVKGIDACRQIEVFEPGYLFNAQGNYKIRPVITSNQTTQISLGQTINVISDTDISKVTFVKPGVVTHATNIEQYFMEPAVTVNAKTANITFANDKFTAPSGTYFMFVWDKNGTPSIAQEITIQ